MSQKSRKPFARVANGLFMGRKPPPDPKIGLVFDAVVLTAYEYQPKAHEFGQAVVLHVPLDDMAGKPPSAHEKQLADEAAYTVAGWLRRGMRVLVTCRQGRNRSGWVTARALMARGVSPQKAIDLVRHARGDDALENPHFVEDILNRPARR